MKKLAATIPDKLRALADVQPVAWMYEHDGCVDTPLFTVNRWTKCEEPWNESPLFLHPAPAAPPHAMLDSHRRLVEQAIHTAEHPSGMSTHDGKARIDASVLRRMLAIIDSLPAAPQAEPKREPLTYEQLVFAYYTYRHALGLLDPDE